MDFPTNGLTPQEILTLRLIYKIADGAVHTIKQDRLEALNSKLAKVPTMEHRLAPDDFEQMMSKLPEYKVLIHMFTVFREVKIALENGTYDYTASEEANEETFDFRFASNGKGGKIHWIFDNVTACGLDAGEFTTVYEPDRNTNTTGPEFCKRCL